MKGSVAKILSVKDLLLKHIWYYLRLALGDNITLFQPRWRIQQDQLINDFHFINLFYDYYSVHIHGTPTYSMLAGPKLGNHVYKMKEMRIVTSICSHTHFTLKTTCKISRNIIVPIKKMESQGSQGPITSKWQNRT